MESSISARYNMKCADFQKKLDNGIDVSDEYMTYQMKCMPFLEQLKGRNTETSRTKINLMDVFNNKRETTEDRELFHLYMKEVEGVEPKRSMRNVMSCTNCGSLELLRDRETISCADCGMVNDNSVIDSKPSFKDMDRINICPATFTYKRENHFKEWLDSLEATGKNDVPDEVLDSVRYELKKQRYVDETKITAVVIRGILKKLKHNKYYDCIPMILSTVIGRPPLVIPTELREKLHKMFRKVQKIYHVHAPKHRSNFFSYPYILYKFCELLEADYVLPYLTLLKSAEKLYQQDQVFKSICTALEWEFIRTL